MIIFSKKRSLFSGFFPLVKIVQKGKLAGYFEENVQDKVFTTPQSEIPGGVPFQNYIDCPFLRDVKQHALFTLPAP